MQIHVKDGTRTYREGGGIPPMAQDQNKKSKEMVITEHGQFHSQNNHERKSLGCYKQAYVQAGWITGNNLLTESESYKFKRNVVSRTELNLVES